MQYLRFLMYKYKCLFFYNRLSFEEISYGQFFLWNTLYRIFMYINIIIIYTYNIYPDIFVTCYLIEQTHQDQSIAVCLYLTIYLYIPRLLSFYACIYLIEQTHQEHIFVYITTVDGVAYMQHKVWPFLAKNNFYGNWCCFFVHSIHTSICGVASMQHNICLYAVITNVVGHYCSI